MSGEGDEEKQHEPTQKKLDDARKKGEIPKSTDLLTAASYGGFLIVAYSLGSGSLQELGQIFASLIDRSDSLSTAIFNDNSAAVSGGIMSLTVFAILPWFAVPALLVLLALISQKSFVIAPEKLQPKLSRISPLSNAKNKFGRAGLFEFAKSFTKLAVYSLVLGIFLQKNLSNIVSTIHFTPALATVTLLNLVVSFFSLVLIISGVIGVLDFLFQYHEHMRKNRMSHKEMKDEHKNSDGDPHIKQQRRQKGYEIAMNQMMASVPEADVIIVNPTHYAVALKWDRESIGAPVCVAKGMDEVAAKIREVASDCSVPIHRDPPTARAIYAVVEIGHEIHTDHFEAVAAAIRFAEDLRKKASGKVKGAT